MEEIRAIELTFVNVYLVKSVDGYILIDTSLAMHWEKLENASSLNDIFRTKQ